jgi:hypothetical protein
VRRDRLLKVPCLPWRIGTIRRRRSFDGIEVDGRRTIVFLAPAGPTRPLRCDFRRFRGLRKVDGRRTIILVPSARTARTLRFALCRTCGLRFVSPILGLRRLFDWLGLPRRSLLGFGERRDRWQGL